MKSFCIPSTVLCIAVLFTATPAFSEDIWGQLTEGAQTTVIEVIDGDTVMIDPAVQNAREIRLVGIQAPKLPLGRKSFEPWPLGEEAKAALSALVLGRDVTVYFGGQALDRHGRLLAHLRVGSDTWAQGHMLRAGFARVYTFPDNRALAGKMLRIERLARTEGRGIWNHPFYAVRTPQSVKAFSDRFEVVEGMVHAVADVGDRLYLNFEEDWRQDFTITLDRKVRRLFEKTGTDLLSLQGRNVRARGWIRQRNGPMIDLDHPERLEILQPALAP